MADDERTAVIVRDPEFDSIARVERRRWRADLTGGPFDGRARHFDTRREARGWCDEFGYAHD